MRDDVSVGVGPRVLAAAPDRVGALCRLRRHYARDSAAAIASLREDAARVQPAAAAVDRARRVLAFAVRDAGVI